MVGYAAHTYFTSNKDEIDKLVAEQKAAEEKKAAEAAAAEPTEVSRQAYDDCDGSGHGYYEITYSDGSVGYEEY